MISITYNPVLDHVELPSDGNIITLYPSEPVEPFKLIALYAGLRHNNQAGTISLAINSTSSNPQGAILRMDEPFNVVGSVDIATRQNATDYAVGISHIFLDTNEDKFIAFNSSASINTQSTLFARAQTFDANGAQSIESITLVSSQPNSLAAGSFAKLIMIG